MLRTFLESLIDYPGQNKWLDLIYKVVRAFTPSDLDAKELACLLRGCCSHLEGIMKKIFDTRDFAPELRFRAYKQDTSVYVHLDVTADDTSACEGRVILIVKARSN